MIQEELSDDDKKRIKNCDYYLMVKEIMHSHEDYKEINVGDVYFIKFQRRPNEWKYVSRTYGGKKDKFMIFHKDEDGFLFAKRINANGKLGKEVQCITTQYPKPKYTLEPDPDYVESIIFDDEASYDPLKSEKELNKKKGRARRKNKPLEIVHPSAEEAWAALYKYKVGDKLYDAGTTYGKGIMEWEVVNVESRKTNKDQVRVGWKKIPKVGSTPRDQLHNDFGLDDFLAVEIVCHNRPESRRWSKNARTISFQDFMKGSFVFYRSKPYTTDDV